MASDHDSSNILNQVRSADLRRYALATGWRRNEAVNGKVVVFQHPSSDLDQLVTPLECSDTEAYVVLVREAVRKLADWEDRPVDELLDDLFLPSSDVLQFRVVDASGLVLALSLDQTIQFLTGIKRMMSAIVHNLLIAQSETPRQPRIEIEEFMRLCQVVPSQRGRSTLSVACPFDLPLPGALLFHNSSSTLPFARQVTQLFMRSLWELVEAAKSNPAEFRPSLVQNLDFYQALLLLRPIGGQSLLCVSPQWFRGLTTEKNDQSPSDLELRQETFELAETFLGLLPRKRSY